MKDGMRAALVAAILAAGSAGALGATGGPLLSADDSGDPEIVYTECNKGVINKCGEVTTKTCRSWKTTYSVGGSYGATNGGTLGGVAQCEHWVETTIYMYKDLPKT